jgi:hypothetical protein
MDWTTLPPDEMERRRKASLEALEEIERRAWAAHYQEICDTIYWKNGQCCAGCDHWMSDAGLTGRCSATGIVSGENVLRSMGVTFSSYTPAPGFPFTGATDHCGLFRDDFDWATFDTAYLRKIGALLHWTGELRPKPTEPAREAP